MQLFVGDLDAAASLVAEAETVAEATGSQLASQGAIALAAWRGHEAEASALIQDSRQEVERRGEGLWLIATEWASAVLFNGLGLYEDALAAAEQAAEDPHELGLSTWVPTEIIEAAVRSGDPERAAGPLQRLQEISRAAGTDWALGVEARSRALLSEGEAAERLYLEAIERLGRTRIRVALARAHLLYGEWLRRENRRVDGREQLRIAHQLYSSMGMEGFAERARRELLATGETVRKRSVTTRGELTAQEMQIAWLAKNGLSNPEIGARLFISARTVQYHWARSSPSSRSAHAASSTVSCPVSHPPSRRSSSRLRCFGAVDGNSALSVESLDPVLGHGAGRAGCRLVFGVVKGRDELRTGGILVGLEVPEPILARLETLRVAMVCRVEMGPCVLAW